MITGLNSFVDPHETAKRKDSLMLIGLTRKSSDTALSVKVVPARESCIMLFQYERVEINAGFE